MIKATSHPPKARLARKASGKPQATSQANAIKSLEEKKFFKLVCGASLNDVEMIEKLSFLFTVAGADVIDLAARADVILAARNGVNKALDYIKNLKQEAGSRKQEILSPASCLLPQVPLLMASIQLDKDPHFRKVQVDYEKCDVCGVCVKICPTQAFHINEGGFVYLAERCYGCDACPKSCHVNALSMADINSSPLETAEEMVLLGVDAIEFHFGNNYDKVAKMWTSSSKIKALVKQLKLLSFSIGSELLSENEIKQAAFLCYKHAGDGIILQCDGKPMSGSFGKNGNNVDNSSLKVAAILQNERLPVYLQLSGGTTEHTFKKAQEANLNINGIALGSYARKLLMPYLSNKLLFDDKEQLVCAINVAKRLVDSVKSV